MDMCNTADRRRRRHGGHRGRQPSGTLEYSRPNQRSKQLLV